MCRGASKRVVAVHCVLMSALVTATPEGQGLLGPVTRSADTEMSESFSVFKTTLRAAAVSCDVARLERYVAPKVLVGYETADRGVVLRQICDGGRPWRSLRDALDLGVSRVDDAMIAPSAYALGDEDATTAVVVGRNVRIRVRPSATAPVAGVASLERVRVDASHGFEISLFDDADEPDSPAAWALVTTSTGVTGYVYGRYLYTADRTRFVFEFVNGHWTLVAWAGGAG